METMSYNKIKKKNNNNAGVYAFFLFIILGTGLITYSIINEPKPVILGEDPLKNIEIYEEEETEETLGENTINLDEIIYKVEEKAKSSKNGNFSINMTLPVVSINSAALEEINSDIEKHYDERSNALLEQMKSAENKFTYKVTHKVYENKVGERRIVSITIHERIIDNATGSTTTDRVDAYNIDLAEQKVLTQEDAALEVLGANYSSLIREQVKNNVVSEKMIEESKYNYTITGLEQFYIKNNSFHMLLNENEVVDKKYGVVDIEITK